MSYYRATHVSPLLVTNDGPGQPRPRIVTLTMSVTAVTLALEAGDTGY